MIVTTKDVGIGVDTANPKPVRGVNWCGNPMKDGDSYWGESEPQPQPPPSDVSKQPRPPRVKRVKRSWTAEQIEAMRARMANARAKRRAQHSAPEVEAQEQGQQNNQQ